MTLKQAVAFGIIFGVVAACIVWYLERFELNRLHGEVKDYLSHSDKFREYLRETGQES